MAARFNVTWLNACCTILCISSWTSSTHRRLGSSSRRICLLTRSSNEISGTNNAGRGPWNNRHIQHFHSTTQNVKVVFRTYFSQTHFCYSVFDHVSKHLEVRQKYSAARRIFNFLLGVWKCGQVRSNLIDILPKNILNNFKCLPLHF